MNIFSEKLFQVLTQKAAYIIAIIFILIYCFITLKKTNNITFYQQEDTILSQSSASHIENKEPSTRADVGPHESLAKNNIDISNNAALKSLNYLERQVLNLVVASSKINDSNKVLNSLASDTSKLNLVYLHRLQSLIVSNILTERGEGKNAYCGANVEVTINDEKHTYRLYRNQNIPEYLFLLLLTMKEGDSHLIKTTDKTYSVKLVKILPQKNDDLIKQNIIFYGNGNFGYCGSKGQVVYSIYNLDGRLINSNLINLKLNTEDIHNAYPSSLINAIAGKTVGSEIEIIIDAKNHDEKYYQYIPVKQYLSRNHLFLLKAQFIRLSD